MFNGTLQEFATAIRDEFDHDWRGKGDANGFVESFRDLGDDKRPTQADVATIIEVMLEGAIEEGELYESENDGLDSEDQERYDFLVDLEDRWRQDETARTAATALVCEEALSVAAAAAAASCDADRLRHLLTEGVSANAVVDGSTLLTLAVSDNSFVFDGRRDEQVATVRALLDGGADPRLPDRDGDRALDFAKVAGDEEIVAMVTSRAQELDLRDRAAANSARPAREAEAAL